MREEPMETAGEERLTDTERVGPAKGEFIAPPVLEDKDEAPDALPTQEEFWRPPVRFGTVPVEKEPLGWDRKKGFRKLFPQILLPTQVVERISFGHPELEPNRLFWGDNLHVMRQLPSESIDLIYIDPPFFSGRQYNIIFGDQNELRSFSDIWEGGMPGYLIWLNARLYEMKRLLKKTGSIMVHCDLHASHYIKIEMDKIFGYNLLQNEIIWSYRSGGGTKRRYGRKHDVILWYTRLPEGYTFNADEVRVPYDAVIAHSRRDLFNEKGKVSGSVWDISRPPNHSKEWIGYPTQKPEALLERIIKGHSNEGDVVADFFCGGGTTPAVAQRLGRRWIACDQSRVAVAITADRLAKGAEQLKLAGIDVPVPDFTIEYWGVYEAKRLSEAPTEQFRKFVLRAFGAVPVDSEPGIHGYKGAIPIWVGEPSLKSQVTHKEVLAFANAIRRTLRYQQDNLREGIMLAWAFSPDALEAADHLRKLEQTDLHFIRLDLIRIDSPRFREHIVKLSTDHADYANFLTFIQPPIVKVGYKHLRGRVYAFDVSESVVMNPGAKIINVQWDFNYMGKFRSTQGYSFIRTAKKEPALQVQYEFPSPGKWRVACKVQDDMGGEGMWVGEVEVK